MDTAFVIAVPASVMLAAHYIPWARFFGRKLPRPAAYAIGLLTILLVVTGAWWGTGEPAAAIIVGWFWAASTSAGLATGLAYLVDSAVERNHRREDEIERLRAQL